MPILLFPPSNLYIFSISFFLVAKHEQLFSIIIISVIIENGPFCVFCDWWEDNFQTIAYTLYYGIWLNAKNTIGNNDDDKRELLDVGFQLIMKKQMF